MHFQYDAFCPLQWPSSGGGVCLGCLSGGCPPDDRLLVVHFSRTERLGGDLVGKTDHALFVRVTQCHRKQRYLINAIKMSWVIIYLQLAFYSGLVVSIFMVKLVKCY